MDERAQLTTEEFEHWWSATGERELRQILYWTWDPIGVNDEFPYTRDEYDAYALQVVKALRMGSTEAHVVDLLKTVEQEQMGLGDGNSAALRQLAGRLARWYQRSQDFWMEFGPTKR
jgi:hypothetical protein